VSESNERWFDSGKNEIHSKAPRFSSCMERKKRGEWAIYGSPTVISNSVRMANGSGSKYACEERGRDRSQLQGGCGQFGIKDSRGSRWERAPIEGKSEVGQKEGKGIRGSRVESVEVYQRGYNDGSFRGIIEDSERDKGYVEFYDLEIDGHPSYYANGCLVHNCHKLTGDASNAMLKLLEDTPSHVYIILCTTDPEKLLKTIKTRCSSFAVAALTMGKIQKLLENVCGAEGVALPVEALKEIARVCNGSPRQALVILDQVIDISDDSLLMQAITDFSISESTVKDLCQGVVNNIPWGQLAVMLKAVKDEPENIRYAVLGYLDAVLLNSKNGNDRVADLISLFSESVMYSGLAGLHTQFYYAVKK
jgi:DNA polymerase III delta prime subunit